MSCIEEREKAWADLRAYHGTEAYSAFIRYLKTEEKFSIDKLVRAIDEKDSERCRGEIGFIRRALAGMIPSDQ